MYHVGSRVYLTAQSTRASYGQSKQSYLNGSWSVYNNFSPYTTIGALKCCIVQLYNAWIVVYDKKLLCTNHFPYQFLVREDNLVLNWKGGTSIIWFLPRQNNSELEKWVGLRLMQVAQTILILSMCIIYLYFLQTNFICFCEWVCMFLIFCKLVLYDFY